MLKQDRSMKMSTLEAIQNLVNLLTQNNSKNLQNIISDKIIETSIELINEKDIFLAKITLSIYHQIILSNSSSKNLYNEVLDKSIILVQSPII